MPFFSIILPTYNSSATVKIAVDSILQQTFTDFEILVIDGLSTDNTIQLVNSYSDTRIKIISEKDNGIYDAMNKGIQLSKGEWLYFLGSDDYLYTDIVLENVYCEIKKTVVEIIYGDVNSTKFNGLYGGVFDEQRILEQNICHQAIFFRKTVFQKIGEYNLQYKAHADWDHNMRWLLSENIKQLYVNIIVAEYADGGFSSTNGDFKFANEKVWRYLFYGRKTFPLKKRVRLLNNEVKRKFRPNNIILFYKLLFYYPIIFFGV